MSKNLMAASHEWATRPADERFWTLGDLYLHTLTTAARARQHNVSSANMRLQAVDGDISLVAPGLTKPLKFTNWSFGQMSRRVGADASFLRQLPPDHIAADINYVLENGDTEDDNTQLYFDSQSDRLRALTSTTYTRFNNHEIVQSIINMGDQYVTPPARANENTPDSRPATEADIKPCKGRTNVTVGEEIAASGIYGSDRNIFVFRINPDVVIDDGTEAGLARGFFVRNSEVGDAAWSITEFWFRFACGNHIIWDAQDVRKYRIRHVGQKNRSRAMGYLDEKALDTWVNSSVQEDEARIRRARDFEIAPTAEEVVDTVFALRTIGLGKKKIQEAYEIAEQYADTDGSPRSAWGLSMGITRRSQKSLYADERTALDAAASAVLDLSNS